MTKTIQKNKGKEFDGFGTDQEAIWDNERADKPCEKCGGKTEHKVYGPYLEGGVVAECDTCIACKHEQNRWVNK